MVNFILVVALFLSLGCSTIVTAAEKYEGGFMGYTSSDSLPIRLSVSKDNANWTIDVLQKATPAFFCYNDAIIFWSGLCDAPIGHPYGPDIFSGTEFNCKEGGMSGSHVIGTYNSATDTWSGSFGWSLETCSTGGDGTWIAKRVVPVAPAIAIQPTLEILLEK